MTDDFDVQLVRAFTTPLLDGAQFVPRVLAVLEHRARRRRTILSAALAAPLTGIGVGVAYWPTWVLPVALFTPTDAMAALTLAALWCAVWVATPAHGPDHVLAPRRTSRGN